jgi:hypothetical protein
MRNYIMTALAKILTAAAAVGSIAAPAAAQYPYPSPQPYQQQYPQAYPNQGYGQNVVGSIIDQLLGNRYNVTDRAAVSQCASAVIAQASQQFRPGGYGQGYNQGYNQGYGGSNFRVTAITDVERRTGGLRVKGLLSSGRGYRGQGYGGQGYGGQGYGGQGYANGDLTFRCNVDYRGAVTNIRISRNDNRRY